MDVDLNPILYATHLVVRTLVIMATSEPLTVKAVHEAGAYVDAGSSGMSNSVSVVPFLPSMRTDTSPSKPALAWSEVKT